MKNKKIISLICALSMIFSVFASFTVVNAADEKGIKLEQSISKDNKTITLNATAVGETGFNNFAVVVNVPENVTEDNIAVTSSTVTLGLINLTEDHILYVTFTDMTGKGVDIPSGKLATIKITVPDGLKDDFEFKLQGDAGFENKAGEAIDVASGKMGDSAVTVVPSGKPTPTPTAVPQPDKMEEPDTPDVPKPVVPTGKGIKLTSTLKGEVVTIDATAVGETGFNNFAVVMNVPENVTEANIDVTSSTVTLGLINLTEDHILYVTFTDMTGKGVDIPSGKLATIKITVPGGLKETYAFTLQGDAGFENKAGEAIDVASGKMTAASAVVDPNAGNAPKPVKTFELKTYVSKGYEDAINSVPDGEKAYLVVEVKKGDEPAVYGTDYVAEYNGEELTEAQYNNLIHGYTDEKMADVIKGLKFKVYNNAVNKISTKLNATNNPYQLVPPVTDQTIGKDTTPTAKTAVINATVSPSTVTAGDGKKVKVTIKITNPGEDGVLTVKTDKDSLDFVTGSGIKVIAADAEDGAYEAVTTTAQEINVTDTVEFVGAAKGDVKLYYSYDYTNNLGERMEGNSAATKTVTVKIKAAETGKGGSSSDTTGKGGSIAIGNNGMTSANGTINFVDLDTVTWAQDAILRLVDKKVVNGRSNTIFDPNGTVTRAEFAKMVVLGFGLTGGAPGNFSDVDTSAWYNNYVQIGYANDVISGYDDGTFRPNGLISRQEMAAMISRAVKAANKNLPATVAAVDFADVNPATEWGYAEISALQTAGVINGMTATTYEPYSNATRAQAAVIIDRAMTNAR